MEKLPQDIETINDQLVSRFGNIHDKPRFKLVWSENELEHRKVTHINKIQLLFPEVALVRKYGYIRHRFILEKWLEGIDNSELVTIQNGNYEPIWVFENKDFIALRPIWRVVEILALASDSSSSDRMSIKDYISQDAKEMEKEVEFFEDMLNDGTNYGNQSVNFVKPVYINDIKMRNDTGE